MTAAHIATLTLTAKPGSGALTDAVTQSATEALSGVSATGHWLSRGDAWETRFELADPGRISGLRTLLSDAVAAASVDINLLTEASGPRRKRLLCADMESTIIEQELIDEIAKLAGRHDEIAAITTAAMQGKLDFAASLVRRVALFEGLAVERLDAILERATLMPGAETLVHTMRTNGARTALISGGFTLFAERIGARLGFDHVVANVLEIENGRLTGRVREPILGPQGKADALARLAREHGLALSDTIAVGDGANDLTMLASAGLGVAFRAKPILRDAAQASPTGAVVTHGDLTALLYLQGYADADVRRALGQRAALSPPA